MRAESYEYHPEVRRRTGVPTMRGHPPVFLSFRKSLRVFVTMHSAVWSALRALVGQTVAAVGLIGDRTPGFGSPLIRIAVWRVHEAGDPSPFRPIESVSVR
jgi:hypothetical protein